MANRSVSSSVLQAILISVMILCPASPVECGSPEHLILEANKVFLNFIKDSSMPGFQQDLKRAKAIMIIPTSIKGGFIFGAEGGSGVMLARDEKNNKWSCPAFYSMRSVSFGLQAGARVAEIILLIMTEKAVNALLSKTTRLGTDVSVTGPDTRDTGMAGFDIHAFTRTKGSFGGISVEGAALTPRNSMSEIYYGRPLPPADILLAGKALSCKAAGLRADIAKYSR